ncbi:MAG: fasciclin domain-containing protein [Candidatus Gastranaerophilales bacterium]|nr:fasciclin domain-containing protein [Candidatus Gastranaerophilales bacterium]
MKRQIIIGVISAIFAAMTLPSFALCPCTSYDPCEQCDPCDPCSHMNTEAGIVNYTKSTKRTNFGVIAKEKQLNEFEKLIKVSGLKPKVDNGNYTVFAPTNDAIARMNQDTLAYLKRPENKDQLQQFVLMHMAPGNQNANCICEQQRLTNLNCCEYDVNKCGNWLRIGSSNIIAPNINTKNGKVHIIDTVFDPYS